MVSLFAKQTLQRGRKMRPKVEKMNYASTANID